MSPKGGVRKKGIMEKEILKRHCVSTTDEARTALKLIQELPNQSKRTLFAINDQGIFEGTITDGDIRRGLLNGSEISDDTKVFITTECKYLFENEIDTAKLKSFRSKDIVLIPILNSKRELIDIIDLSKTRTILPMSALIMAGGRGERLKPLTDSVPKPMLVVGSKPIIEHNIDRLIAYGVKEIFISVKYLKEQIMDHFGDGTEKGISIKYIEEDEPLGTLGCLSLIKDIAEENLLVMNSDLLTNIDFEYFYNFFIEKQADMLLASVPYKVSVPYAVLETENQAVKSFSEKPTYTYYSNGGIYLIKTKLKSRLKKGVFYNATDLMESVIQELGSSLIHFPILDYWLDIGKHQDFTKAQEDIKRLHM
ncbi:MAG: dTDP-glucose pyrophosphorylase [Glaciecola sp.]|jgi:dTDP-glucose pyrophosphorylase